MLKNRKTFKRKYISRRKYKSRRKPKSRRKSKSRRKPKSRRKRKGGTQQTSPRSVAGLKDEDAENLKKKKIETLNKFPARATNYDRCMRDCDRDCKSQIPRSKLNIKQVHSHPPERFQLPHDILPPSPRSEDYNTDSTIDTYKMLASSGDEKKD